MKELSIATENDGMAEGRWKWENTLAKVREGITEKVTFKLRLERQSGNQEEKCSGTRNSKEKAQWWKSFICLRI